MVCSLESGRMAVMARLLEAESFSKDIAEEVGHQKLAAQYLYRELCQADEANLLDEEDMHVFGLKPMADPLKLVCCNACKRPVKASQYAAHAELCRSLSTEEEAILDNDVSTGHRKPPRKERKKLLSSYNTTLVGEQERSRSIIADDTTVSESQVDGHIENSSFSNNAKRVSLENTDHAACVVLPQIKRSKLQSVERLPLSDELESDSGQTKTISPQDAYISRGISRQTVPRVVIPNDCVVCKTSGQIHECCLPTKDVPAPLATKMYYSQRNNRLSSTLSLLFQEVATKEFGNMVSQQSSQKDTRQSQASSRGGCSFDRVGDLLPPKEDPSTWKDDQVLAQNLEACLDASGGRLQDFSNQFSVDNVPMPQVASIGLMRSQYLSDPYSFSGNSRKLLGTVQQQNGSVHVV